MSGQLREEIAQTIQGAGMVIGPVSAGLLADYLLAGPLRPLVAAAEERDALRATVARVDALHHEAYSGWCKHCADISDGDREAMWPCATRRALDDPR